MGRMYFAGAINVAMSAAMDLVTISAPSDAIVVVHQIEIAQTSEEGDDQDEQLQVLVHRTSAVGSGGSTTTPRPYEVGMPAFGGTVRITDTTQATPSEILLASAWNVRAGWVWVPTPECRPVLSPSGILVVESGLAPADSVTVTCGVIFEEIGG